MTSLDLVCSRCGESGDLFKAAWVEVETNGYTEDISAKTWAAGRGFGGGHVSRPWIYCGACCGYGVSAVSRQDYEQDCKAFIGETQADHDKDVGRG